MKVSTTETGHSLHVTTLERRIMMRQERLELPVIDIGGYTFRQEGRITQKNNDAPRASCHQSDAAEENKLERQDRKRNAQELPPSTLKEASSSKRQCRDEPEEGRGTDSDHQTETETSTRCKRDIVHPAQLLPGFGHRTLWYESFLEFLGAPMMSPKTRQVDSQQTREANSLNLNTSHRLNATATLDSQHHGPHSPVGHHHQQQKQVPPLSHHVAQQYVLYSPVYSQQRKGEESNSLHATVTVPPVQELHPRYYHDAPVFRHCPHCHQQQPWTSTNARSSFVVSHDDRIRGYLSGNGGTNRPPSSAPPAGRFPIAPQTFWEQKYKALKEYQKENGHCNVPHQYPPNPSLGNWVANQRTKYREFMKAKADGQPWKDPSVMEKRIAKLEALGFVWKRYKRD